MPIDASIYQNAQPIPMSQPNLMGTAQQAYSLANMGMQNQQMQLQLKSQQATRQAFSDNTDQNGNINWQGALGDIAGAGFPLQAAQLSQQKTQMDMQRAQAQSAQAEAVQKVGQVAMPYFQNIQSAPIEQRPAMYHQAMNEMASLGIPMANAKPDYDPDWVADKIDVFQKSLAGAQLANAQSELQAKGAEELGKFNEDVNNASSRKTTGALINARDRADRIVSLLQPLPNESQAQTLARLNQYMPQVGNEVGSSIASIMQGGIPSEELTKEVSPDTLNAKIANLKQQWSANPTPANQGALLQAYGDIAQKLRDFSASRLGQVAQNARAAYPYANKYFSKQMDQISAPLTIPGASTQAPGPMLGQDNSGSGGLPGVPSANASEKVPNAMDTQAVQALKAMDPSNPKAFKLRAILKSKGLL